MCRPISNYVCAECLIPCNQSPYAVRLDNRKICDDCAYKNELAQIGRSDKYSVYGPTELKPGEIVSTWPGNKLGTIVFVGRNPHPWTVRSFWGKKYNCDIRMVDGSIWSGWIGEGIISNIKRKKVKSNA